MSFFSTLTDMLESALESIADGINKISDAIPSPDDSSSSSRVVHTSARDALRRAAEKESAVAAKSFFQKHHLAITDAEIDELVQTCSASPASSMYAKFESQFERTPEMRKNLAEIDALTAQIQRLEGAAQTLRTLASRGDASLLGETEYSAAKP